MSCGKMLRRRWRGTIRTRLTLWSAFVTTAVCVLVCGVLYVGFRRSLECEIDGFLAGEAHEMAALLARHAYDRDAVQTSFDLELGARPRGTLVFRLKNAAGSVLVSSDATARQWRTPMPPTAEGPPASESHFATIRIGDGGHPMRVCSLAFAGDDGKVYVGEAIYALGGMYTSLSTFRYVSIAALLVAVAGAVAGGMIVAQHCLRPVKLITRKAERIGAQQLQERLPLHGTGDELDNLAATLNRMLDRVEEHVVRMRRFTADASHELRSPLAVLRGNAEVALSRPRSAEELRASIEQSVDHYDRLTRIADDLLLLARGDAGELRLAEEPVSLTDAVRDVSDLYGPFAEEREITLRTELNGLALVRGDHTYLRQLLSNLIDNAVKYSGNGKLITIALASLGDMIQMKVIDNGPGIPPADVPHVFDRFYRADAARSGRGPRGCGLGLPICRMIAEAHGGGVWIESTPGGGTTAVVQLPAIDRFERRAG
ncbi:MAG: Adaptive-response sensory-kinase SasA [Phycisphaerae bacterium]|nr:Adaptive-response sensory-kinase SasA [Phycisphaerae bacterium]